MELLTDEQIAEHLSNSQWEREGDEIVREGANHHPDILLHGWNKVRLSVMNHSAGGLTEADFKLAAAVDGRA